MYLKYIGGCVPLFFMAVIFDLTGIILIFVGIFANVKKRGKFYGDFLIYNGSLLLFTSLAWWLMWYAGNIQVTNDSLERGRLSTAHSFKQFARKLTERLSKSHMKNDGVAMNSAEDGESGKSPIPDRVESKLTWGKSSCYENECFEDDSDSVLTKDSVTTSTTDITPDNVVEKNIGDLL